MSIIKQLSTFSFILMLCACTSIPLKTLYHLSKTDLMSVNPSHLQAATRTPNDLQEGEKGVQLSFSSWLKGKEEKKTTLNLKLERMSDNDSLLKIKQLTKPGYTTRLYKISDKDIQRFKLFRLTHQKNKKAFGDNLEGEFSVTANYCRSHEISNQPILVSTWIQTDKETGLLALFTDNDMKKEMKENNLSLNKILPMCDKPKDL